MNESCPAEDAVLVQMSWGTDPLTPFYNYHILPKNTEGCNDIHNGVRYEYLRVNRSLEVDKGTGPFMHRYELTYLGEGKVAVVPLGRWFLGKLGNRETVVIVSIEGWNA